MFRRCTKCLKSLNCNNFYKQKTRNNALAAWCKKCHGIATKRGNKAFLVRRKLEIIKLGGKCLKCGDNKLYSLTIRNDSVLCKSCLLTVQKTSKVCNKCNRKLPRIKFYRKGASKDGLAPTCIKCALNYTHSRVKIKSAQHAINKNRLRGIILDHYGNKCSICNENNADFLVIDHIDGGGTKIRRDLNLFGMKFYRLIIKTFPDNLRLLCHNCNRKEYDNSHSRNVRNLLTKASTMKYYGDGKCACCNVSDLDVLCLDHIKGGGAEERRKHGSGANFYRVLAARGYPSGYQVLCFNCNFGKFLRGICPHQNFDRRAKIKEIKKGK
jgi:hypothetical protein